MEDLQSLKDQLASYLDSGQGKQQLSASQAVAGKGDNLASHLDRLRAEVERCTSIQDVRLILASVVYEIRAVREKLDEADAFYAELYKICEKFGI